MIRPKLYYPQNHNEHAASQVLKICPLTIHWYLGKKSFGSFIISRTLDILFGGKGEEEIPFHAYRDSDVSELREEFLQKGS